jgi:hypothetical protein
MEATMLRIIPSNIHGVIDYITGATLLAAPYLFGFADGRADQWVPTIIGLVIIGQSLMTQYELSVVKIIPMPTHLMLDAGTGILLAASPWLFGFADRVYLPHLLVGLMEVAVVLLSDNRSKRKAGFSF